MKLRLTAWQLNVQEFLRMRLPIRALASSKNLLFILVYHLFNIMVYVFIYIIYECLHIFFSSDLPHLRKPFKRYLKLRGIKPSTIKFLHEYMINKISKRKLIWMKKLKKFIEAWTFAQYSYFGSKELTDQVLILYIFFCIEIYCCCNLFTEPFM